MAGGNWEAQNKVRPGAYTNTVTTGGSQTGSGVRGVVALPLPLNFGPSGIKVVTATTNLDEYATSVSEQLLLRETLKRAATVLLGRVGGGAKATKTESDLTITATHGGSAGNGINVIIAANVDVPTSFTVTTYLGSIAKHTQVAKTIEELEDNVLVTFSGTGNLAAATILLTGGTTTATTASDYSDFFEAVQVHDFNTLALPVEDSAIKTAGVSFVKRLRNQEGRKCQAVVAEYTADTYAAINVKNGVILSDGTVVPAHQAVAWVAGATAGAGLAESLTYTAYDDAVDVDTRYLDSEIVESILRGEFVFVEKRGQAIVEIDINSHVSFTATEGETFRKNRLLRVIDAYDNNTRITFEDFFIGKINRDLNGAALFKANRVAYLNNLQDAGAIEDFVPEDVVVEFGEEANSYVVETYIKPVDAAEKLYHTTYVR